ncbi:MAG: BTAD domain-containing putative transcriptional regulator, partial [Acidimicrobiales bacterium]
MEYRLLGPVEAIRDGVSVDLTARQRALLALLLVHADEVVSSDRIIDELWAPSVDKDRQNALWVIVSRLRALLEPDREKRTDGTILLTRPPGYLLATEPGQLDVHRFVALEAEARALVDPDPAAASQRYGEALALWRGRALEEFTYDDWALAEISRLEELRLAAIEGRIDAALRCGRSQDMIGELESLVRLHPHREGLVRLHMVALYRAGRQGDALRVFADLREHLAETVGLDPATETVRLEEQILLDDPSLRLPDTATPVPTASVRGYELREPIATGPTGTVYRAFQPVVGREVAITIVERGLANEPEFIRRFEHEARSVASLEHPRIVPVFDFWREPDAALLVTRHFPRGTLTDLVAAGPVPAAQARVIVDHIAAALDAAHRRGLVHGGVGPDQVMIDDDTNAYLTGFGIHAPARVGGASPDEPGDTDHVGRAEDLAALDALAGFLGTTVSSPDRNPSASPAALVELGNPYRGLRAFDEADQGFFFGRERLVERLIIRLGDGGPRGRFVVLAGPSGSGKSSVVRAGLMPALRRGAAPDSEHWFIVTMTPGDRPFDALAEAMRRGAVRPPGDLAEHLAAFGIAETAERCSPDPSAQTVIVIDQFEELFTRAPSAEATVFMDAVAAAVADRHSGVKVVATLRADFLDRPLRHPGIGPLLPLGTEMITPMDPAELEAAMVGPARALDVGFEAGLVTMITADVVHQSAALPLLQHTLTELFDRRVGHSLTAEAYRELGGVSAALARRAELIHDRLSPDDQAVARDAFLRLVTVTEGAADTRRRVPVRELVGAGPNVPDVLEAFGRHRLLTNDCDPISREPTVEVSHEALLGEWVRLAGWIDGARDHLLARRRLTAAAHEWVAHDEHPDDLLAAAPLERFRSWIDDPPLRLDEPERRFLVASAAASTAEIEAEHRRIRRLRFLVLATSSALVLALIAGSIALWQQRRADRAADQANEAAADAELAALVSRSAASIGDDPELALLLALEARRQMPGTDADRATLQALGR